MAAWDARCGDEGAVAAGEAEETSDVAAQAMETRGDRRLCSVASREKKARARPRVRRGVRMEGFLFFGPLARRA